MPEQQMTESQQLQSLANHVHNALRMVKMGETATISCGKQFQMEQVWWYVVAYGIHKGKWFKMRRDQVSGTIIAERSEPPKIEKQEKQEEVP
jgi:hypothetical protein